MRDPYDGKPYYCKVCGEGPTSCECADGRRLETELEAMRRKHRKRPFVSDSRDAAARVAKELA